MLPGTPAVLDSLRRLASPEPLADYPDPAVVELLAEHGLLLDQRDLTPVLHAADLAPHATAALARTAGPGTVRARSARRRWRTADAHVRAPVGHRPARAVRRPLASAAGLREAASRRAASPDCGVLLGVGEPDRTLLDDWTRSGTPYLLVRLTEGRAVVGPFVVPGSTACLRCVDAHCTDADPAWPLLVTQYASLSARDRADGAPEPLDPLLAALALAWAARDLTTYVDGGLPSTWSGTVTLHPQLSRLETRRWLRHPGCGCSWDPLDRSKARVPAPAAGKGDQR